MGAPGPGKTSSRGSYILECDLLSLLNVIQTTRVGRDADGAHFARWPRPRVMSYDIWQVYIRSGYWSTPRVKSHAYRPVPSL